ncbi:MAG: hypothetical protein JRH20_30170 [Deltaproteobacteria bacterium]|nr:hypothetical protein [Deltaproteobacteria bacterium]
MRSPLSVLTVSVLTVFFLMVGCGDDTPSEDGFVSADLSDTRVRRDAAPSDLLLDGGGRSDSPIVEDMDAPLGDFGPIPAAPRVRGEVSAGHARPSWFWDIPSIATGFRYRVDASAWQEASLSVTFFTAPSDLPPGAHVFEVQARGPGSAWSASGSFVTTIEYFTQSGFFHGVARDLATTPYGHICAVSAHNCYQGARNTSAANLAETLSKIHAAQAAGADLIELDIKEQGGVIRVEHEDTGGSASAPLADVLADAALRSGDQLLFIEIKETAPSASFIAALLELIRDQREHYARNGRPLVLRAFYNIRTNLDRVRVALNKPENLLIKHYVRTSMLYSGNQEPNMARYQQMITAAKNEGHQMVEFPYTDFNLSAKLNWAHAEALGVNLWTVPNSMGEVFVASLRDETDVITTDYPVNQARAVVQGNNALFYLDATDQRPGLGVTSVPYQRTDQTQYQLAVNGAGQPTLASAAAGGTLYGGHLVFDPAYGQSGLLYDADARPNEGVLVSAVAKFDTLTLPDGATMALLSKTDSGGFCIELHNPAGPPTTILRFGVRVGTSYVYATLSTAHLNTTQSYLLTGAYDGDGGVRFWVDNRTTDIIIGNASGPVVNNDSPVRIGADPQGSTNTGFHFDGRIQRVLGQAWGSH